MPKISIVIPIYNQELYLKECLDSIINQTFSDIEIICINDCSTDNSLCILNKYQQNDNRMKIISLQKNMGTGFARNIGIDSSSGEYIMFIDPDDYIELNACEILYKNAKIFNSDFVEFLFDRFDGSKGKFFTLRKTYNLPNNTLIDQEYIIKNNIFSPPIMAWNKFYKLEFLKTNKIYFFNSRFAEDHIVTIKSRCLAKRITAVNFVLYHYRIQFVNNQQKDIYHISEIMNDIKDFLKNNKILDNVYRDYFNYYTCHSKLLSKNLDSNDVKKMRFNKIIPLGYNCQVSYALEKIYGKSSIESYFFNWIYVSDINKFIQYLYEPQLLLSKGLDFDERDFMYTDIALNFRYHTKKEHRYFYNSDGTLNNIFVENDKIDVSSRMRYLANKFRKMLACSKSKNLFVLCFKSNIEYEKVPDLINSIAEFFYNNCQNKKSKVLFIFEEEYFNHLCLKQYDNIIYKTITDFAPDSYADCVNIEEWKKITKNIMLINKMIMLRHIFSIKNEYRDGIKHKVVTLFGIKFKFKIKNN